MSAVLRPLLSAHARTLAHREVVYDDSGGATACSRNVLSSRAVARLQLRLAGLLHLVQDAAVQTLQRPCGREE